MALRRCQDCKWSEADIGSVTDIDAWDKAMCYCAGWKTTKYHVGEDASTLAYYPCVLMRQNPKRCGKEARYFEQAISKQEN